MQIHNRAISGLYDNVARGSRIAADVYLYHDSINVTRFLPPKRCKTCED